MEELGTKIFLAIIFIIFLAYIALVIKKSITSKNKEAPVKRDFPPQEIRYPKYRGTTSDSTECYHNRGKAQYHIMLDPPSGHSYTWAHEEMNAHDSLLNAFNYDRSIKIEILDLKTQEHFLRVAKKFDSDGWPMWKDINEHPATPKESFKAYMSACCGIKIMSLFTEDNGAHRCPKCNKFCKVI